MLTSEATSGGILEYKNVPNMLFKGLVFYRLFKWQRLAWSMGLLAYNTIVNWLLDYTIMIMSGGI